MAEVLEAELSQFSYEFYSVADRFFDPFHLGDVLGARQGEGNSKQLSTAIPY